MSSDFIAAKAKMPYLGVGLGLRRELADEIFASSASIDWLEIVPENYMDLGGHAKSRLEKAKSLFPIVTHGVNLSVGSSDPLNKDYLSTLVGLLDFIEAPWWTDHLCFTSIDGFYLHDLLPLPLSAETVKHVIARAREAQALVGRPLLLENISYYMHMPESHLQEADFIWQILEGADCGLLLDVNNVYVNSINLNFDPYKFIDDLPLERVVQMHVAGHSRRGDLLIDTHGADVIEPVFDLLAYALKHTDCKAVLLERDQNYPESFETVIAELDKIRQIVLASQPGVLPAALSKSA
ncbi:MAG: DUF692 domain-containing protein [Cyanobacteria bacterium REEB67]|nr:DUF692 domain-containing protein [Cyanobacteria bacterium REEB67]